MIAVVVLYWRGGKEIDQPLMERERRELVALTLALDVASSRACGSFRILRERLL